MPTNAELILLDSSAAIAYVSQQNRHHEAVSARTSGHPLGLAGHAAFETYSVLTRLPTPARLGAADASRLIDVSFPETRYLGSEASARLLHRFVELGILGGAVYDGLVAAAAEAHDSLLVSCDQRAANTYRTIGVRFDLLSS